MIWRRVVFLLRRRAIERELADEMAAHREMMSDPRDFGNVTRLREEAADVWGWRWLDEIALDVKHGLRVFRRAPSFALTAVAVLSLGLGLNLGLFQLLNVALLRPLEIRDPGTMVRLGIASANTSSSGVPYPVVRFVEANNSVLSSVVTTQSVRASWGESADEQVRVEFVSPNFFEEFGAGAAAGRVFRTDIDSRPDADTAVMLSERFWRSRYGSDPRIVGAKVHLNGRPATVVGVATIGFYGPSLNSSDAWALFAQWQRYFPGSAPGQDWTNNSAGMYGRLKPGISEAAARDGLRAAMAELRRIRPADFPIEHWLNTASGAAHFRRDRDNAQLRAVVLLAAGLSLLVLLVACANLASLMVAHSTSRTHEFQMRAALGAGRLRVLRQLLTECAMLVGAGLAGGWFIGYTFAGVLLNAIEAPVQLSPVPDWRVVMAAFMLGALSILAVGLLPALRVMRGSLAARQGPRTRLQRALIGAQVMGSCVLLIVSGLMARKLQSLATAEVGFQMDNLAVLDVSLERYGIKGDAAASYWRDLRTTSAAVPHIHGASLTTFAPMGTSLGQSGYDSAPGLKVTNMTVDPEFIPLLGIPILAGRNLQPGDTKASAVLISRRLAIGMYGSLDVVGRSFPIDGNGPRATIVGVTGDTRLIKVVANDSAELYRPMERDGFAGALLVARVDNGNLNALRDAARAVNPSVVPSVRWMRADYEKKLLAPRLVSVVSGIMGSLALVLTCIGIFGLIAYTVLLRTREIGIRMALGARASSVLWTVMHGLAVPVVIGGALGFLIVRFGLAKPLSGEPLYAELNDPAGIAASLVLLSLSGLAAAWLPAARALRIDPSSALRQQ